MPLLVVALALLTPRIAVLLLWFFTRWFEGVFPSITWTLVGFLFLPTTLLWYSVVHYWWGGVWTLWPLVGLVVAVVIDVSPAREHRRLRGRPEGA